MESDGNNLIIGAKGKKGTPFLKLMARSFIERVDCRCLGAVSGRAVTPEEMANYGILETDKVFEEKLRSEPC